MDKLSKNKLSEIKRQTAIKYNTVRNLGLGMTGKKHKLETIEKMRLARLKNPTFKSGINSGSYKHGLANTPKYNSFIESRRRARKLGNGGSHTIGEWLAIKSMYQFMCLCCKRAEPEIQLTQDHVIPISKGGNDDISNIQPLCFSCNGRKQAKIEDYRLTFFYGQI